MTPTPSSPLAPTTLVERLHAAQEWMREPDWDENFSLSDMVEWMNDRPTALIPAVIAEIERLSASPAPLAGPASVRDAVWNVIGKWDIQRVPGGSYAGATGTDADAIVEAVRAALASAQRVDAPLAANPAQGVEAWLGEGDGFKSFTRSKATAEKWRRGGIKVTSVFAAIGAGGQAVDAPAVKALIAAIQRIVDENEDFRLGMPSDWEGDPLQDAIEDAHKVALSALAPAPSQPDGEIERQQSAFDRERERLIERAREQRQRAEALSAALVDLLSWFDDKPSEPEWRIKAGEYGADDAIAAARSLLHGKKGRG